MSLRSETTSFLGLATFSAFLLGVWQQETGRLFAGLEALQSNELYRAASGCVLAGIIAYQWYLSWLRWKRSPKAKLHLERHRLLGALSPLVFFFHATHLGYAYLLWLTVAFLANHLLGCLHPSFVRWSSANYTKFWMVSHILFSCLVAFLALGHIYVAGLYT